MNSYEQRSFICVCNYLTTGQPTLYKTLKDHIDSLPLRMSTGNYNYGADCTTHSLGYFKRGHKSVPYIHMQIVIDNALWQRHALRSDG